MLNLIKRARTLLYKKYYKESEDYKRGYYEACNELEQAFSKSTQHNLHVKCNELQSDIVSMSRQILAKDFKIKKLEEDVTQAESPFTKREKKEIKVLRTLVNKQASEIIYLRNALNDKSSLVES